ncbi:hypothetical protein BH10PSE9_BH10PSE9_13740 [soil metagenome]
MRTIKKLGLAAALIVLTAAPPASAGGVSAAELRQVATLRNITRVVLVDTAVTNDRWVFSKRAMQGKQPLTPLQVAIAGNSRLMAHIRATAWSFDLKSVYAVETNPAGEVFIYLGEPPSPT